MKKITHHFPLLFLGLMLSLLLFSSPFRVSAEDKAAAEKREKDTVQESKATGAAPVEKRPDKKSPQSVKGDPTKVQPEAEPQVKRKSPQPAKRDPTRIEPEVESQLEEAKAPEIRVTGMIEAKGQKAAMAELNLEGYRGMVMLEPGMMVSIPKPSRRQSESRRWMTFFEVSEINHIGVLLIMENGERVWVPVMMKKN